MTLPWILVGFLLLAVLVLAAKILDIHAALHRLSKNISQHLNADTNTLITLSTRDRAVRNLASTLNQELRTLRQLRWRYQSGTDRLHESVTNISHDLRTPLTVICGYLELLESQPHTDQSLHYLTILKNRSNVMHQLIEELFSYTLILGSNEKLTENISVNAILEETIASFYPQLAEVGIEPEIHIPETKVIRPLNRNDLSRIFSNLLSNAVKYSDGDLIIRLEENGTLHFSNHASSLDSVQVGRLFDRYYTLEAARKSTGLGLSIARTLLEQMGGRIEAAYEGGQILLTIYLPA